MFQPMHFSEREHEVISLLLKGKSNKEMAVALNISVRTVEFHLSNIYTKLEVSSRTEAALRLTEIMALRDSTGIDFRESTVSEFGKSSDNKQKIIPKRRLSMKIFFPFLFLAPLIILVIVGLNFQDRSIHNEQIPIDQLQKTIQPSVTPNPTQPSVSPKEHIMVQIRQAVAEYDRAVQAEKQIGDVDFSIDPDTGEEIFLFKNGSYFEIMNLNAELWDQINQLNTFYVQIYRDEFAPTPFPTQVSEEESGLYYDSLISQVDEYCLFDWTQQDPDQMILVYNPDEGKYLPIGVGDQYARCTTYGQMIEEWRISPLLANVDQTADMEVIRQITGNPNIQLTFQTIQNLPNAPGRNAALYLDNTGTRYFVDIETARLAVIEPDYPSHPDIQQSDSRSMDELRGIARQFAMTNSPNFRDLESTLSFEENCKENLCFFDWRYQNKDWSNTNWNMMPPFLQVGVLINGQIATYINTFDLSLE
jgi:DNA-binding CsgD family transcriptional regulator